jgi:hypothetical protein
MGSYDRAAFSPPRSLFKSTPPRTEAGASALDALLEERREGR